MCPFVLICCSVASVRSALGTVLRELRKASQGELVARSFWRGASETVHWEAGARACSLSPKDDSIHMLNSKHNRHTHSKMEGQAAQCSLPLVRREGGQAKLKPRAFTPVEVEKPGSRKRLTPSTPGALKLTKGGGDALPALGPGPAGPPLQTAQAKPSGSLSDLLGQDPACNVPHHARTTPQAHAAYFRASGWNGPLGVSQVHASPVSALSLIHSAMYRAPGRCRAGEGESTQVATFHGLVSALNGGSAPDTDCGGALPLAPCAGSLAALPERHGV